MSKPTLFLMLGYPGAGKTTVSKLIHELTGAVHLWADKIRGERFEKPTHSHRENLELYAHLNELTAELLATGQSVIFDTNFNFYKDREKLRKIASDHGATSKLIWVTTPKPLAKRRAVHEAHLHDNRILGHIPEADFERMAKNLEPPKPSENAIEIIGEGVNSAKVKDLLDPS